MFTQTEGSRGQKRKEREKKVPESKKKEAKRERSSTLIGDAKKALDDILDFQIGGHFDTSDEYDPFDTLSSEKKIILLEMMLGEKKLTAETVCFYHEQNVLNELIYIRDIFTHPAPENRVQGDGGAFIKSYLKGRIAISPEEREAARNGVFKNVVYFTTGAGFPGPALTEEKGILGLTSKVSEVEDPIKKQDVIDHVTARLHMTKDVHTKRNEKKESVSKEEKKDVSFELKSIELTDPIRKTMQFLMDNNIITLHEINQWGLPKLFTMISAYNDCAKNVRDMINDKILPFSFLERYASKINKVAEYINSPGVREILEELKLADYCLDWDEDFLFLAKLYTHENVRNLMRSNFLSIDEILDDFRYLEEDVILRISKAFVHPHIFELIGIGRVHWDDFFDRDELYTRLLVEPGIYYLVKLQLIDMRNIDEVIATHQEEAFIQSIRCIDNLFNRGLLNEANIVDWGLNETIKLVNYVYANPVILKSVQTGVPPLSLARIHATPHEERMRIIALVNDQSFRIFQDYITLPQVFDMGAINTKVIIDIALRIPTLRNAIIFRSIDFTMINSLGAIEVYNILNLKNTCMHGNYSVQEIHDIGFEKFKKLLFNYPIGDYIISRFFTAAQLQQWSEQDIHAVADYATRNPSAIGFGLTAQNILGIVRAQEVVSASLNLRPGR